MLTDISIEHVYMGKKAQQPLNFIMHPIRNSQGAHADRFEILHAHTEGSKKVKLSAHLTEQELAELFARGLPDRHNIRIRVGPAGGGYPDALPGKRVSRANIASGSSFDRKVQSVDVTSSVTIGLREQLARLSILV